MESLLLILKVGDDLIDIVRFFFMTLVIIIYCYSNPMEDGLVRNPCLDGWMQPPPSPIHPIYGWVNGWMPLAHGWMNRGHHSPTHPMEWGMQIYLSIRLVASISHLSTHPFIHHIVSSINPCNQPLILHLITIISIGLMGESWHASSNHSTLPSKGEWY